MFSFVFSIVHFAGPAANIGLFLWWLMDSFYLIFRLSIENILPIFTQRLLKQLEEFKLELPKPA
jgi:hypothetical protein